MSLAIVNAIYTQLTTDQTAGSLYAAVSGRIYHLQSIENGTLPLLVFGVVSCTPAYNFNGSVTETTLVEFTIYNDAFGAGAAAIGAIEAKLLTTLDNVVLSPTGYDRLTVRCEQRGVSSMVEDAIASTSVYRCIGTRT
jgi:hypothetical protein